jgi:3-phenylpropionate/trans-cinnamate dioxygenase ferredoxin reductase subunit
MVIIGAGVGGARAAFALRENGWKGAVTLVGDEALLPYDRPPLSKAALAGEPSPEPAFVCDDAALAAAGIEFLVDTAAVSVDAREHEIVLADERRLRYERLLLAVGARARPLAVPGGGLALTLRTHADALAIHRLLTPGTHVGVVGGGLIGLELAASAITRGCAVTVIEVAPHLMSRAVPTEIAAIVAARHAEAGVRVVTDVCVHRIAPQDGGLGIALSNGETLRVNVAIAAIGAVPATALAVRAGLAIDNGIRADAQLRTSNPDIFVTGDCCSMPHPLYEGRRIRAESWRNALDQAAHAALNMLDGDQDYSIVPWFWSDQHDLGLQVAGRPDAAVHVVVRKTANGSEVHFGLDGSGRLVSASGVGRGNAVAKDVRLGELLIAQRAAPTALELSDSTFNLKRLLTTRAAA